MSFYIPFLHLMQACRRILVDRDGLDDYTVIKPGEIMEVEVIKARKKHLWDIRALYRAFVIDEYKSVSFDEKELKGAGERTNSILRLLDEFQNPTRTWLVALDGEIVLGTAMLTLQEHSFFKGQVGRITLVVVARSKRNMGIGQALLDKAQEIAKKKGCNYLTLSSVLTNEPAMKLYDKAGYQSFMMEMIKKI